MKLADLLAGRRARSPVTVTFGAQDVTLDVRVLGPDDDLRIASEALAAAKTKGAIDPGPGNDIYDRVERAWTLFLGCVDHDSPEDAPTPFFASVDELLGSKLVTRDHIAFLYESQYRWQDECSPRKRKLTMGEYMKVVAEMAAGDMSAFFLLAPGTQAECARSLARTLVAPQMQASPSTST